MVGAVIMLSGCGSDDRMRLQEENRILRTQLEEQHKQWKAELEFMEMEASIAAGCDWILPICPQSVVEKGRQAQANGFAGSTAWYFWAAFIGKMLAAGAFLGGLFGFMWWLWIALGRPEAHKIAAAEVLIQEANQRAITSREEAAQQVTLKNEAKSTLEKLQLDITIASEELVALEQKLDVLDREILQRQAAQKALDAFN